MKPGLPILLCLALFQPLSAQPGKVLLIGIDGCRADAVLLANAPHLQGLLDHATYSFDALTHAPTWSGAGWSSMLTGVWEDKHGVLDNTFNGAHYDLYPHFFDRLEQYNPALRTASICHWAPINDIILHQADLKLNVATDLEVKNAAVTALTLGDPDALFLHFDDVDHAGHDAGFSPTVPSYLAAVETTDGYVGEVLAALRQRPGYAAENWLVLVSTDHGGNLNGHGGPSLEERNIFIIAHHPGLSSTNLAKTTQTLSPGPAVVFNGVDQYVLPAHSNPFQFGAGQDFTVELRVRYDSLAGDAAFISNKDWDSGLNQGWVISTPFSDQSRWKVNVGDGVHRADATGGVIDDGNWHHLAVVFDRDAAMTLYQDGEPAGSASMAAVGDLDSGLPLVIGQDGTLNYPYWFRGQLAEVRIWDRALSGETIRQFTCAGVDGSHPDFSGLLAYWKMDEGAGPSFADATGNGNQAVLQGAPATWAAGPGQLVCTDFSQTPRMPDVAVTALTHLCVPIDSAWGLDGQALVQLCGQSATVEPTASSDWFSLSPNPAGGQATVTFRADLQELVKKVCMWDATGRLLSTATTTAGQLRLDLDQYPSGVVQVEVRCGDRTRRKWLALLR